MSLLPINLLNQHHIVYKFKNNLHAVSDTVLAFSAGKNIFNFILLLRMEIGGKLEGKPSEHTVTAEFNFF
jgi:hypothetical protein